MPFNWEFHESIHQKLIILYPKKSIFVYPPNGNLIILLFFSFDNTWYYQKKNFHSSHFWRRQIFAFCFCQKGFFFIFSKTVGKILTFENFVNTAYYPDFQKSKFDPPILRKMRKFFYKKGKKNFSFIFSKIVGVKFWLLKIFLIPRIIQRNNFLFGKFFFCIFRIIGGSNFDFWKSG